MQNAAEPSIISQLITAATYITIVISLAILIIKNWTKVPKVIQKQFDDHEKVINEKIEDVKIGNTDKFQTLEKKVDESRAAMANMLTNFLNETKTEHEKRIAEIKLQKCPFHDLVIEDLEDQKNRDTEMSKAMTKLGTNVGKLTGKIETISEFIKKNSKK